MSSDKKSTNSILSVKAKVAFNLIEFFSGILGFLLWVLLPSRRSYSSSVIAERLNLPKKQAKKIARKSFSQNAKSFLEIFFVKHFHMQDNHLLAPFSNNFKQMLEDKRPIVAATAHIGAWELLAGLLGEAFPDRPRMVVIRNNQNKTINAKIKQLRASTGAEIIGHRNAAPQIISALRQNGVVAFLVDHNSSRVESVFLPFLGHIAAVNSGPALLALRAKAIVYPIFLLRGEDGLYHVHVDLPLDTSGLEGTIAERTKQIAGFYTAAVEKQVKSSPEQWFWMHKRWKTRPPKDPENK